MTPCIIMKTSCENIRSVLKLEKHATEKLPTEMQPGWLLLIHQEGRGNTTPPRVTHTMLVDRVEEDHDGTTVKIWGKHWRWIIHGKNLQPLTQPIPIGRFGRASGKNYGRGAQKFVYLDDADLVELLEEGLLSVAAWQGAT